MVFVVLNIKIKGALTHSKKLHY